MKKGSVFVVSGPSGVGKDTVISHLFNLCPNLKFSISTITRKMRPGEVEGDKYNFTSVEHFKSMIEDDMLLEYASYVGNYYGTPRKPVDNWLKKGYNVLIEVDTQGALKIKEKLPEAVLVFILPPSLSVLKSRLVLRATDSTEVITERIAAAKTEIERSRLYDYVIINKDGCADKAAELFSHIIFAENHKTVNNLQKINEVLNNA